jgi:hypothetical protein
MLLRFLAESWQVLERGVSMISLAGWLVAAGAAAVLAVTVWIAERNS